MLALSPIIKLTESCNLACAYCYQQGSLARSRNMAPFTLERILSQLAQVARKPISLLWYGGEPTMVGRESFQEAIRCSDRHLGQEEAHHSLQTNGVLIDERWADLLADRQFRVRLSLDGPAHIHDLQRPTLGGRGSHQQVVRSLEILHWAGLKPRIACTVTRVGLTRASELIDYFSDLPVEELDFSPALRFQENLPEEWITGHEYGQFLIEACDAWLARSNTSLSIRSLSSLVRRLAGLPGNYCKVEGQCSRYLTFGWDGQVYPCDELSALPEYCLGNVLDSSLGELLARRRPLPEETAATCLGCRWEAVCPGSLCPFERMMNGGLDKKSLLCDGWRRVLEHLAPRLSRA